MFSLVRWLVGDDQPPFFFGLWIFFMPMQIKKDYTREQIVEIAKRVFLKKGYAKTSMRDIANGAGIGVSNIYNYFIDRMHFRL